MKRFLILLALAGLAVVRPAAADQTPSDDAKAAVAQLGAAYAKAFDAGDAKALAAFWLPDGEYVDLGGKKFQGRDQIQKLFEGFFAENKGARLLIESESLRSVSADVVMEDGTTAVSYPDATPPSRARFSNLIVNRDGKWLLASVREATLPPADRSAELGVLSWLLGDWVAKTKSGEEIRISVAPSGSGNFLVLQRAVLSGGNPAGGGTEWIGWDASLKSIRSWSFDDDGGFGESRWSQKNGQWFVDAQHTLRDGTKLNELQTIAPEAATAVRVKSLKLSANDTDMTPGEELVFKRPEQN